MRIRELEKLVLDIIKDYDEIEEAIKYFFEKTNIISQDNLKLQTLYYNLDFINFQNSIRNILIEEPPKFKVKAFWFGIFESSENNSQFFQSYISASNKFSKLDEEAEWAVNPKYFPHNRYINSNVLKEIYEISKKNNKINELSYLPLWYTSIIVGIFVKHNFKSFLCNTNKCEICVGFDEGDFIHIGTVSENEFKINRVRIPKPKKLKLTKTKSEYYVLDTPVNGAHWSLGKIWNSANEQMVCRFAAICKKINPDYKYYAKYDEGRDGIPVDIEDAFQGPIVSKKVKDTIEKYTKVEEVEFIPITIVNYDKDEFFIMNVLSEIDCLNRESTKFHHYDFVKLENNNIALNRSLVIGNNIFRVRKGLIGNDIYINSIIKNELEKLEVTGAVVYEVLLV